MKTAIWDRSRLAESRAITVHENYVKWWEAPEKARQTIAAVKQMGMNILHVAQPRVDWLIRHRDLRYRPSAGPFLLA